MEFKTNKWYVYKKYPVDIYIPLCWDGYVLEFDSEEDAKDFMRVAIKELNFESEDVVYDNIAYFSANSDVMNATFYRVRAGYGGIKDYLYDIRKG